MSRRSDEQNRLMWSRLTDLANQVEWPVDGRMQLMSPTDWKDVCSAGLTKVQRIAHGVEGGFVILGASTSKMTVAEMGDLIDFIQYFGDTHNVEWSVSLDNRN